MYDIVIMFMLYATIGWFWETPFVSISQKKLINRGFLHGPYIPIYGLASITIMLSMDLFNKYINFNSIWFHLLAVVYIAIVASIWEYSVSYLLELIFSTRWWDYSYRRFNLNGRIALDYSIGWGIGGYLLWYFINTPLMNIMDKLSSDSLNVLLAIFYTVFTLDAFMTIHQLMTLRDIIKKLVVISNELSDKVTYTIDILNDELDNMKKHTLESVNGRKEALYNKVVMLRQKADITLTDRQRQMLNRFNSLLERSRAVSRFYINYPRATSKRLSNTLRAIRYKRKHEK